MGKAFNIIATVVLVAAAYFFPPAAPLFWIAAGYYYNKAFGPTLTAQLRSLQTSAADGAAGVPVIYGYARTGLRLVDVRVDTSTENDENLYIVGALCHGSQVGAPGSGNISAIQSIWFDQNLAFNDDGVMQSRYRVVVWGQSYDFAYIIGKHLGSSTQTVNTTLATKFPSAWTANHRGRGVAYLVLKLVFNESVYDGIPNVNAKVKGAVVFDVRTSTWAWSENPALCIYDYLTSPIYGLGVPSGEIDTASFQAAANYCDELVSTPNGNQVRFQCDGILDTNEPLKANLARLLSSCRGALVYEGGKFRLVIRRPITQATLTLDPTNILGDWNFLVPGARETMNVIKARYPDRIRAWQAETVQFPEPGVANGFLTDDNNFLNEQEIDLPMTDDRYRALQIAQVIIKESRSALAVQVTCSETALQLQVGDLVPVTHPTPGWTAKLFWVLSLGLAEDNTVRVTLIEYQSSAYTYTTLATDPGNPGTSLPDPFTVGPPTGLTLVSNGLTALQTEDGTIVPRIKASWTPPVGGFVDFVEIRARILAYDPLTEPWTVTGSVPAGGAPYFFVSGVREGDDWEVWVRTVGVSGVKSAWVTQVVTIESDMPVNQLPYFEGRRDAVINGLFEDSGMNYWCEDAPPVALDATNPYTGTHSLRIDYTGSAAGQVTQVRGLVVLNALSRLWVRTRPGEKWKLSCANRTSRIDDNAYGVMTVNFYKADKATPTTPGSEILRAESLTWVVTEKAFTIPAECFYFTIGFYIASIPAQAPMSAWFDDAHCLSMADGTLLAVPLILKATAG